MLILSLIYIILEIFCIKYQKLNLYELTYVFYNNIQLILTLLELSLLGFLFFDPVVCNLYLVLSHLPHHPYIQQFFVDMKTTRANYKSKVIQAAIEQQRRSKQREVNEASTQFAHKYIRYMQSHYPDLAIKEELQGRAIGHSWFYFYPFSDSSVYLVHQ